MIHTEHQNEREPLFVWVFHVELNVSILAVVKWAVVMNKYLSVSFIEKGCIYPKWTSPIESLSIDVAVNFILLKFRMTNASLRALVEHKTQWTLSDFNAHRISSENCKAMRVWFTVNVCHTSFFRGILCFLTFNSITSVLLGMDRIVYMKLVQLIFTVCVYCSTGVLPLLPDKKVLCTVNDAVPNLCPTATADIVNVSPG